MENFENYEQYLKYMESNMDEEDQITIENFISYYMNTYKGFGKKNCEMTYQEELKNDENGKLHEFALVGVSFEKKIFDEKRKIKKNNK